MTYRPLAIAIALFAPAAAGQDLGSALDHLVSNEHLAGARVGVLVRDLADGRELCTHDADRGFMTASNMKLISSATALVTLGPDFRYETRLVATGPLTGGVLSGDLVLVGSGDPTFGGRQEKGGPRAVFERLVGEMIERHGLTRIEGRVLGDDDCQPDEVMGDGWAWNYQGDAYAAQVSGLCFAENAVTLIVTPTAVGAAPTLTTEPVSAFFQLENRAICIDGEARSSLWTTRRRATNRLVIGGNVPAAGKTRSERLSVENPTAYAAFVLAEVLRDEGVTVEGAALDRDDIEDRPEGHGDHTVLATHRSAPLGEILVTLNKVSQNLYAEQVIRTASRVAAADGSMRGATAQAREVLRELGGDPAGLKVADGSGLTRLNLVHPRHIADLLTGMWRHEYKDAFFVTLPIAGVDGTLESRMKEGPAAGRVRAKTGYIGAVVALSGYVPRLEEGAEPLVFSILINNFTCRTANAKAAIDRFVEELCRRADA